MKIILENFGPYLKKELKSYKKISFIDLGIHFELDYNTKAGFIYAQKSV